MSRRFAVVVLSRSLLLLPLTGCGYSLAGRGSSLPATSGPSASRSSPTPPRSSTSSRRLTQRVRLEFIGRGKYRVVPDETGTDAVLKGEITAISVRPTAFTQEQQASRYEITVVVKVEFRDVKTGKVLFENPGPDLPRGVRGDDRAGRRRTPRSSARTRTRSSAWPTTSPRRWSARSSKRSDGSAPRRSPCRAHHRYARRAARPEGRAPADLSHRRRRRGRRRTRQSPQFVAARARGRPGVRARALSRRSRPIRRRSWPRRARCRSSAIGGSSIVTRAEKWLTGKRKGQRRCRRRGRRTRRDDGDEPASAAGSTCSRPMPSRRSR